MRLTFLRCNNIISTGLTSLAVIYQDDKARNRAMGVVLSGVAAGALGKSLQQLLGPVHTADKVEIDFDTVAILSLFCQNSTVAVSFDEVK